MRQIEDEGRYTTMQAAVVHRTIPPLETLKSILLLDVADAVNKIHSDRVLYATVVTEPFKTASIHILIQDSGGQMCRLCLYNYPNSFQKKLRAGTGIAVLAPYMKHSRDDPNFPVLLRCDHPAGVIVFENKLEWSEAMRVQDTVAARDNDGLQLPLIPSEQGFQQAKERGNKAFLSNNYLHAVKCYTDAFSLASSDVERLIAVSNRCQCYLNISAYPEALVDADRALAIDASHTKSAYRRAMALFWSRRPEEALAICLSPLAKEDPAHSKVFKLLAVDAKRAVLELRGQYDCPAMMTSVQADGTVKGAHLDYVHPSISVVPSAKKGRSVVSSTDIEPGTILMVCKAFLMQPKDKKGVKMSENSNSMSFDFYSGHNEDHRFATAICGKLETILPRDRELLLSLSAGGSNDAAAPGTLSADIYNDEIARISGGRGNKQPPSAPTLSASTGRDISSGTTTSTAEEQGRRSDGTGSSTTSGTRTEEMYYDRVIKIIQSNAFRTSSKTDSANSRLSQKLRVVKWERTLTAPPTSADYQKIRNEDEEEGHSVAIFILPSLFNHSCCANAEWFSIGDFLFVRTIRCISQGTELTVPYLDKREPYYERKKTLRNWIGLGDGFECDCSRCQPIAAISETFVQRIARADTEMFIQKAFDKVSELVVNGMPKMTAVNTVISRDKIAAIKRETERLPVQNQEALVVLLEFEIGRLCESGDADNALRCTRQLLTILEEIDSSFDVIKFKLILAGLVFYAAGNAPVTESRDLLRSARTLSYPEIRLDSTGNSDFELICDSYCFMVQGHHMEAQLRKLIRDCRF